MSSKSRSRSCTSEVGSVPADRPDAALIALGHAFSHGIDYPVTMNVAIKAHLDDALAALDGEAGR